MSYYVYGAGTIFPKEGALEEIKKLIEERLKDFEDHDVYGFNNQVLFQFYDGHNYEDLESLLPEIADKVSDGWLYCDGEDHEFWKVEFRKGAWFYCGGIKDYKSGFKLGNDDDDEDDDDGEESEWDYEDDEEGV